MFDFSGLITGALDGIVKAAVLAGMPEEEARVKVNAGVIAHAGFLQGELSASDREAAAARAEADRIIAAGAPGTVTTTGPVEVLEGTADPDHALSDS